MGRRGGEAALEGPVRSAPNDFAGLAAVERRLLAFQTEYEALAAPFEWKFSRADLHRLMARLEHGSMLGTAA